MRRATALGLLLATSVAPIACRGTPSEAPAPARIAAPASHSAPASAPAPASASPAPGPSSSASAPSPSPSASALAPESLVGSDGGPLPQTEEKPSASSAAFRARVELVARAILSGDPKPAHAAFFPLAGYRQVKAIQDPDRDYERRLLAAFDRDVAEYHRALGKNAASATFSGIDVPEQRAEWMKPGREGNKVGYYRVLRAKLRFLLPEGKERAFELTSMISWRGEWYVVHLSGFD